MGNLRTGLVACFALSLVAVGGPAAAQTTGRADAPPSTVTFTRDTFGVPYVNNPNSSQASYALGYAAAQDRLWQMELVRREAEGTLSEVFGPSELETDEITRRDGYTQQELNKMFERLPLSTRKRLNGFIAGINYYISQAVQPQNRPTMLPAEFLVANFDPKPWTSADLTAAVVLIMKGFGTSGGDEIDNAAFYLQLRNEFSQSKARGIFDDFFWISDPDTPTTVPPASHSYSVPPTGKFSRYNAKQMAAVNQWATQIEAADATALQDTAALKAAAVRFGLPIGTPHHSNAVAISGALSKSGVPLLLGGPQTGLSIPSFWWQTGVITSKYNGAGTAPPFGPGFAVGRTQDGAYTITSGLSDVIDTYIDTFKPGHPQAKLHCRTETYNVLGLSEPVKQQVCRTVHGPKGGTVQCPVFYLDKSAGVAFSRCFAIWKLEMGSGETIFNLGGTDSLRSFRRLLPNIAANFNLTYADRDGNIAYFHNGRFPIRPKGIDPRFPLIGGKQEWVGYLAQGRKPFVINPTQGWLTNWNNDPEKGWPAMEAREQWGVEQRIQGFMDVIKRKVDAEGKLTLNDLNEINFEVAQKDVFASRSVPYLQAAVAEVPSADPDYAALNQASTLIGDWVGKQTEVALYDVKSESPYQTTVGGSGNGAPLIFPEFTVPPVACPNLSCNYPDAGLALYEQWREQLQHDLFDTLLGARNREIVYQQGPGDQENDHGSFDTQDAVLMHLLQGPSSNVPPSCDYFNGCTTINKSTYNADRDAFLVNTLREVIHNLPGTPDQATVPVQTEVFVTQGAIPNQTINWMNRGSFNILAELANPIVSFDVVPPGQSGLVTVGGGASPNVADQLELYAGFAYKPLEVEAPSGSTPVTIPYVP
jgi:acyl-homoserine lactone acylase PvdQ